MSRCAQFIGLTRLAEDFVSTLTEVPEGSGENIEEYQEKFDMRRWVDKEGNKYDEVVQVVYSSGGSMIFTCLNEVWDKDPDLSREVYSWVNGHYVKGRIEEFDDEKGIIYL